MIHGFTGIVPILYNNYTYILYIVLLLFLYNVVCLETELLLLFHIEQQHQDSKSRFGTRSSYISVIVLVSTGAFHCFS